MKRLSVIACCLFVIFAGAASAWANCKRSPLASDAQKRPPVAAHTHDHESHGGHEHTHQAVIHCLTLDDFLLTALFSTSKDHQAERVLDKLVAETDSQLSQHASHWLTYGPPGFSRVNGIPPYLLLSVLRI